MCGADSGHAERQRKDELNMQKESFNLLKGRQDEVNNAVSRYLSGPGVGFDPKQFAMAKSQFLNSNAAQYNQAGRNVRTALLRTGSADSSSPVGGDYVRGISGLESGMANNASGGLLNIDMQNLQQALNNKFNAASLINGQAATLTSPISSFGQGASSALQAYNEAANSGFGATLGRSFAGSLGKGLGAGVSAFATGGLGALGSFGSGGNG